MKFIAGGWDEAIAASLVCPTRSGERTEGPLFEALRG